jgi:hypothetical protein
VFEMLVKRQSAQLRSETGEDVRKEESNFLAVVGL